MDLSQVPPAWTEFKSFNDIHFPSARLESLKASLTELDEFVDHYHFIYQKCPKTNLLHASIVMTFDENSKKDPTHISEATKQMWSLAGIERLLSKKKDELVQSGPFLHVGIPPLQRMIPQEILQDMCEDITGFHFGSNECFSS